MNVNEQLLEVQDRILTRVESAQDQVLEMNRRMAEAMTEVLPRRARTSLPFASRLPDPVEMVDQGFDFAARMMDVNRKFYREMVQVWALEVDEEPAPAKTAPAKSKTAKSVKKTAKATRAKASAKAKPAKPAKVVEAVEAVEPDAADEPTA